MNPELHKQIVNSLQQDKVEPIEVYIYTNEAEDERYVIPVDLSITPFKVLDPKLILQIMKLGLEGKRDDSRP